MKSRVPVLATAAAFALAAMSAGALAGSKSAYPVSIAKNADGTGYMVGSQASTRNSASPSATFGCYYEAFPPSWGGGKFVSCSGYNGTIFLSCSTTDPAIADTISKIASDSYLWVEVATPGICTRVQIGSQSWLEPKAP
jgi:hypothetical protein